MNHTTQSAQTGTQTSQDEVTVLVFKDNDASRTFRVPLSWISQLGLTLGILAFAAFLTSFFAVKFYRVARQSNPIHVSDLEQELSELRTKNKTLEAKISATPITASANPAPPPPVITTPITVGGIPLFTAFPRKTHDLSAEASKLPFTVSPAKTFWKGKTLNVGFNIQYTGTDKGSQQGRIIILARGPETILSYPDGVFTRAGNDSLISPEKGEFFSVSRFREVKADFNPVRDTSQILDVEVMILGLDGQLLAYEKLSPSVTQPATPKAPAPVNILKPKTKALVPAAPAPATSAPAAADPASSELIEPGVDQ